MLRSSKIFITGHNGMLGKVACDVFVSKGYTNIITASHNELDLKNQQDVSSFFLREKPEYVIHIAAKVGGINANMLNPAVFLFDNIVMQNNVINAAYENGVKKFIFIASSCIYPRECAQPMKEDYILDGKLEPTNEGYAIAKIAGIKLIEAYHTQYGFKGTTLIPCNLYGQGDSYDLDHAHVLSSLVKKFVDAQKNNLPSVHVWGTGIARREFMHVNDFANAILFFFENHEVSENINVGPGIDITIRDLVAFIVTEINYNGTVVWDDLKPDGMLQKCMNVDKMKRLGFEPKITLLEGIRKQIASYRKLKL
jgi:GDP-L-fucose synthase